MYVLGISCFYHDSAAALVKDGSLIAAAEEERFSRQKHTSRFPSAAVRYCLSQAGITIDDVDYICFYEKPFVKFDRILTTLIAEFPRTYAAFMKALPLWLSERLWTKTVIQKYLGTEKEILFNEHHMSHAASAYFCSPFERAAILTVDGVGEWCTTAYGIGEANRITLEGEIRFPHSLGLFYSAVTAYLGFHVNDAEWKVMGLAAYGQPRYVEQFEQLLELRGDGSYRLNMDYFAFHYSTKLPFSHRFERLFGRPQRKPSEPLDEFHNDIAASAQLMIERAMVNMASALYRRYKVDALCLAGGVALNSVANWQIARRSGFKHLFIQPAAGDAGGAIGAAFSVYHLMLGQPRKFVMEHAYWGPEYSDEDIVRFLDENGIEYKQYSRDALLEETAKLIMADKVVGWFQGRMEFGPRALGARSILANPTNPDMKRIINSKIKFREWFRPFAPSVTEEDAAKYFDIGEHTSPFMLLVPEVRPEARALIPAVTHQDGTGRVQTVSRKVNPLYYDLIRAFERISGVPVIVNTSFNVRGEPIVCTPADAYNCFIRTDMDALVIGNAIVTAKTKGAVYSETEVEQMEARIAELEPEIAF
ncbi:MAG: carbamoyltransferase [Blastocatellia bacterium]|nr:carbamoyltransferase [Blastocatellia bacterium]